jgi:hypothetical protein
MELSVKRTFLYAAAAAALSVAVLTACTGHGTGSITPTGTTHGTFRYCSYTPTGSGIKISRHEHVPCVVDDTRSTGDRKKTPSPVPTTSVPGHPSPTAKPSTKPPTTPPTTPPPTTVTPAPTTPPSGTGLKKLTRTTKR